MRQIAAEMQVAYKSMDKKWVYKLAQQINPKYREKKIDISIDSLGNPIMPQEDRQNCWADFLTKKFTEPPIIVNIPNDCEPDPSSERPSRLTFTSI